MKELQLQGLNKGLGQKTQIQESTNEKDVSNMEPQKEQEKQQDLQDTAAHMELLTEYFGFCPIDFVDDIINTVNDLLYKSMDELEKIIRAELTDEDQVERGMAAVETLFENAIDKYFDKFELYCMSQIFVLPNHGRVVLPHYEGLDLHVTGEEEAKLDEEIAKKQQAVLAAKFMNHKLTRELESLEASTKAVQMLQSAFEGLQSVNNIEPAELHKMMETLAVNLSNMKRLSYQLRRRTLDVSFRDMVAKTDERTQYLKSSIASYLEAQTSTLNESLLQTPRKRRLSRLSLGPPKTPRTPGGRRKLLRQEPKLDCSAEFRAAMQIGSARNIQVFREMVDNDMDDAESVQ